MWKQLPSSGPNLDKKKYSGPNMGTIAKFKALGKKV